MTVMICKDMIRGPLEYGNGYVYKGLGEIVGALIVVIPTSIMFLYVIYKIAKENGSLKEVYLFLFIKTWKFILLL